MEIGLIHPGVMGATLLSHAVQPIGWASRNRSRETRARAERHGLVDHGTIAALVERSDIIVCVCPPHAAMDIADDVRRCGFDGIYVDANAVSPETSERIGAGFSRYVDGSILGPPPTAPDLTRLYLAGTEASTVASLWEGSFVDVRVLEGPVGTASALKTAFAGWTKGSAALLLAMYAYAESVGVADHLTEEWAVSMPDLPDRLERTAEAVGPKAWRFTGEMDQIAAALEDTDLPPGFHEAAAEIYVRLADLKGNARSPLAEVMKHLIGTEIV